MIKGFVLWYKDKPYNGGFGVDGSIYQYDYLAENELNARINVSNMPEWFDNWIILPFKFDLSHLPKLVDTDHLPIFTYYLEDK